MVAITTVTVNVAATDRHLDRTHPWYEATDDGYNELKDPAFPFGFGPHILRLSRTAVICRLIVRAPAADEYFGGTPHQRMRS